MSKNIIAICGFLGSGKNTAGDYFIEKEVYFTDSFASPLKDCVSAVFGWDRDMLEGLTKESRDWREQPDEWWEKRLDWKNNPLAAKYPRLTPRRALQIWGTEVIRRNFDNDIWVASLERRLENVDNDTVITDARFPNEFDIIRRMGGKIIRIKKGPEPDWYETAELANSESLMSTRAFECMVETGIHESEWAWIGYDFDAVIENDGTIQDMYDKLAKLV